MKIDFPGVRTAAKAQPTADKIIMHGGAGVGKSTLWAHSPDVLFIPCRGEESGIAKLAENQLIPDTCAWLPEIGPDNEAEGDGWITLLRTVTKIIKSPEPPQTVVLDCCDDDGFLALAYQHHGREAYKGDMGPAGFMNFQNGYSTSLAEIKRLTHGALQALVERGTNVVLLMHTTIGNHKNPEGADYNRFIPNVNQKYVWPLLRGWADMVLYASRETTVVVADGQERGKAKGGRTRMLNTSETATYEAKNRHGLPSRIKLPDDPTLSYITFLDALKKGKK